MCELASAVQRRYVDDPSAFGTVGEWQGSGRGTAWERHGMCESALRSLGIKTCELTEEPDG
jgi:hypothetical protein